MTAGTSKKFFTRKAPKKPVGTIIAIVVAVLVAAIVGFAWKPSVMPAAIIAFVLGLVVCGVLIFAIMPSMMVVTKKCNKGFDETVNGLLKSITDNGWSITHGKPVELHSAIGKQGIDIGGRVNLVLLCNGKHAGEILEDRYITCMMPCSMGVWEGEDGNTYLSKVNMKLMASMFGGKIAEVMGGKVVKDEEKILKGIIEE